MIFNTRITAFSTYLQLPRGIKMTVCLITKKCLIIRHHILCGELLLIVALDLLKPKIIVYGSSASCKLHFVLE